MEALTWDCSNVRRDRVVKTMMDHRRGAGSSLSYVRTYKYSHGMEGFSLAQSLRVQSSVGKACGENAR